MAYPTDPSNPGLTSAGAFVGARITADEAERLAALFRPSWEIDEAPVAGPPPSADGDSRARLGGAAPADVRGAVHALNGTHAPAPAAVLHEPSVIVEPGLVEGNDAAAGQTARPAAARRFVTPAREPAPSIDLGEIARRPKLGLWIALGAAAIVLIGGGFWLASGSEQKPAAPVFEQKPATAAVPQIPPPPPLPVETAPARAAQPPAPSPPPPPTAISAPIATQPTPPAPAPAAPPPAPPPRLVVPPAPRPPTWSPSAAAGRPAARPKGSAQTIVRDVPF